MSNLKTLADSINDALDTGKEATFLYNGTLYTFSPAGIIAWLSANPTGSNETITIALTDEITPIVAVNNVIKFRMPFAMTLTGVRASLNTAQTSGNIVTVDINKNTTTVLSTKLTIDNEEKTSTTADAPAVISVAALADDDEIEVDIDQVGDGTAIGLKITLIGTRT